MTRDFDSWRKEAERILIGWHRDDPDQAPEHFWLDRFQRGDRPFEAAAVAHDFSHHASTAELRRRGMVR
jgi:hypothetical protein